MTQTRSQRGITPRKTEHPGFVETPTRRKTSRKSIAQVVVVDDTKNHNGNVVEDQIEAIPERTNGHHYKANGNLATEKKNLAAQEADAEAGSHPHYEFGGPIGVSAMMVGFPILMYYMWIGATYYDGKFPRPAPNQSMGEFFRSMGHLVFEGAFPHLKAWAIYWTFFIGEALLYVYLPGVSAKGKPLPHERGKQLDYHCSGLYSWYATIAIAITLHVTGLFPLYTILDEFGPLMSVAILSGVLVSIIAYISAFHRGVQHRMTGNHIYDFFMGAELNPRILGILDFKMFFEVRIPWFILFLLSLSAAARQYEQFGYVSGEVAFLVLAHWLYANACAKGEELIITTWFDLLAPNNESADRNRDMYYEKWGFMLIFWNLAGVPLSYCHCTLYLANRAPSAYHWNGYALAGLYASYLFIYWIWDTTNSQKNRFRHSEKGGYAKRKAFPQLPWSELENPKTLKADNGGTILVDGWYAYARKIHYTCDVFFAISWGLITGFSSPFPWFYPVFFVSMIAHRAWRDIKRCRERYGQAWIEYERRVPYLFIPYVI